MRPAKLLLSFLLCLHLQAFGQTDLVVTGNLDVEGNTSTFGTVPLVSEPGVAQTFDATIVSPQIKPSTATASWDLNSNVGFFNWRHLNSAGTALQSGLSLNFTSTHGILKLYSADPSNSAQTLTLAAGSTSSSSIIPGNLQVRGTFFWSEGTQNLLPNQILNSTSSIVTRSLGDARYLLRSEAQTIPTLVFGVGSSAAQSGSIALGAAAVATGGSQTPSIAIGKNVTANASSTGYGSMVIGWNSVAGTSSTSKAIALGDSARAYGERSLAWGHDAETTTTGYNSLALGTLAAATSGFAQAFGYNSRASGYRSTSLGANVTANGFAQTVVGYSNIVDPSADPGEREENENVFIVGNGMDKYPFTPSNAFTIQWDGDGRIQGDFTTGKGLIVTENAAITGDASIDGDLEGGKASFSDTVRIEPRGGISMGEFTYDPEAPPPGP